MRLFWTISRWAFVGLVILLAVMVATKLSLPGHYDRPEVGCYWDVSLVWTVGCKGFVGSKLVAFLLTLPLIVFSFGPIFLWYEVTSGRLFEFAAKAPIFLLVQVVSICWLALGLLYPFRWLFLKVSKQ
jgi:hypothetical protein